jgi:NADP-dependent 3-hydroxy acid dehydrogenase YdfG
VGSPLEHETLEDYSRLIGSNQTGTLLGMQAAIPAMRARPPRLRSSR